MAVQSRISPPIVALLVWLNGATRGCGGVPLVLDGLLVWQL